MGKIIVLDENTSNKIAAGEVIERPASVVKELVENSIDAGASMISVEIRNGGISFIKVADNGSGMEDDDVELSFERHATSKIRSADDLDSIASLGFRGEALASIAAVSSVEMSTRNAKNAHGTFVHIRGGKIIEIKQTGCPVGTTFTIRELFFNTPARFKFLKKDSTEAGYISDIISRIALGNPQISFRLISGGTVLIHTPGNNDLHSTIYSIYGKETARELHEIHYSDPRLKISGFAGSPAIARATRSHQSIFLNGRYIKSKLVGSAVDEAYKTLLMKNKFPFIVLKLDMNPAMVDVNVHPTKMEVRFSDEQEIFRSIYHAVSNALLSTSQFRNVELKEKQANPFKMDQSEQIKVHYTQQKLETERPAVMEKPHQEQNYTALPEKTYNGDKPSDDQYLRLAKTLEPKNAKVETDEQKNDEVHLPFAADTYLTSTDAPHNEELKTPVLQKEVPTPDTDASDIKESNCELLDAMVIGQVFSTYILLQHENDLILVDQHAAHERIKYDAYRKLYEANEAFSQVLMTPLILELTHQELTLLKEEQDFFEKLGFNYEEFGNNSVMIRAVPYIDSIESIKDIFLNILDKRMKSGKKTENALIEDALYTIACKAAVKANKKMDVREIRALLKELSDLANPFTCPHGRPTVIKISKYELEKKFKRV